MIEIIRVSKRSNLIRVAMKGKKKLVYIPLFGQISVANLFWLLTRTSYASFYISVALEVHTCPLYFCNIAIK